MSSYSCNTPHPHQPVGRNKPRVTSATQPYITRFSPLSHIRRVLAMMPTRSSTDITGKRFLTFLSKTPEMSPRPARACFHRMSWENTVREMQNADGKAKLVVCVFQLNKIDLFFFRKSQDNEDVLETMFKERRKGTACFETKRTQLQEAVWSHLLRCKSVTDLKLSSDFL